MADDSRGGRSGCLRAVVEKRLDYWSARGRMIEGDALAWIVALVAAISGSLLMFSLTAGKVSPSPLVPDAPTSVVELGGAGLALLDLLGMFAHFLSGRVADSLAVMQTSPRSAQRVVFVAHVAIPYPWQRQWWRWRRQGRIVVGGCRYWGEDRRRSG